MAKARTEYVCSACGAAAPKWAGQCGECEAWNTLVESIVERSAAGRLAGYAAAGGSAVSVLDAVDATSQPREATGNSEFDRVLGGGLVPGSVVLIGGDPGIGKSTLLLQVLAAMAARVPALYVSGEESLEQLALRARRLKLDLAKIRCVTETSVERILATAAREKPAVLVVDSIQSMYTELLASAPGSVAQVRESAAALVRFAKQHATSVLLVGHVTKQGGIAGPRVLEHMVDAVLYFEGEGDSRHRVIRSLKNRFGAANELGVFAMSDRGLRPVSNPSAIFLSGQARGAPGSVVTVIWEGTRPLLIELQALVADSHLGNPRRLAVGTDPQRLAMLLAVLQRLGRVAVSDQDVFVNAVGGIRIGETAADLPLLLAVNSSFADGALPPDLVAFGEVGLTGEIRPVPFGVERLKEAAKHGFKRAIVPRRNAPKRGAPLEIIAVERLRDALEAC